MLFVSLTRRLSCHMAVGTVRLLLAVVLASCSAVQTTPIVQQTQTVAPVSLTAAPVATPRAAAPAATGTYPATMPTATLAPTVAAVANEFRTDALGFALTYPAGWQPRKGATSDLLTWLQPRNSTAQVAVVYGPMTSGSSLQQATAQLRDAEGAGLTAIEQLPDKALTLRDGRAAWQTGLRGKDQKGNVLEIQLVGAARGGRLFTVIVFGVPGAVHAVQADFDRTAQSMRLGSPVVYGIPRDQALLLNGGESNNPRSYDPATGGGNRLLFSGLVSFNPQLEVVPELAERWDVSADGTVYTFHLRPNARFHNGRPVVATDIVYSWERAADPAINSDDVLTYLGDVVGLRAKRAGQATTISGLRVVDDQTLAVTIDAPKPYFVMKLTYTTAAVVDQANIESGPTWYETPNGTGPYKLIRWEHNKVQLYERNLQFYLGPPAIPFIVEQLYAGVGTRLYETGDIDITAVGTYAAARMRDPAEPLQRELHEGVSMCTSYITLDVAQPPFDDPKVRQAFALATDKTRYNAIVQHGEDLVAQGLYPPALPGYRSDLRGPPFDPALARQRLAESKYGGAAGLPPLIFTTGGFGSDVGPATNALIDMWQRTLGVKITVENVEADQLRDRIQAGQHGQLFEGGWCADYPDPENFADALFHSGAAQNRGHYRNPTVDTLLDQARTERDTAKRIGLYQQAEQLIVDDAAAIFLVFSRSAVLVKPQIQGYVLTPIAVPIERYLRIDAAKASR